MAASFAVMTSLPATVRMQSKPLRQLRLVCQNSCMCGTSLRRTVSKSTRVNGFLGLGEAGKPGSGGQDAYKAWADFTREDVEFYFEYAGILAVEGNYDRFERYLEAGLSYVDILLILAAGENDEPKVIELLESGANPSCKTPEGLTPREIATSDEVKAILAAPKDIALTPA